MAVYDTQLVTSLLNFMEVHFQVLKFSTKSLLSKFLEHTGIDKSQQVLSVS
jgi:hypothetical protein